MDSAARRSERKDVVEGPFSWAVVDAVAKFADGELHGVPPRIAVRDEEGRIKGSTARGVWEQVHGAIDSAEILIHEPRTTDYVLLLWNSPSTNAYRLTVDSKSATVASGRAAELAKVIRQALAEGDETWLAHAAAAPVQPAPVQPAAEPWTTHVRAWLRDLSVEVVGGILVPVLIGVIALVWALTR